MANPAWEVGYHLRSPKSWLNDPNGCCQFRGAYHVFYQYDHDFPHVDQKAWGHFLSPDLVHWTYEGVAIEPSIPEDRHGVYSGCVLVEHGCAADGGDRMRAFYTGNVICAGPDHDPRDRDFVLDGREANEITCTSDDGIHFGEKTVVLRNADYPASSSLHVRDPKVWEQDGELHMVLGARHVKHHGELLLYDSEDGLSWRFRHAVHPAYPFGYMWECPNVIRFADGHEYVAFSPQGLPRLRDRWHNLWQAGYIPLSGKLLDTQVVDERDFVEWDHGHDFYAPQMFEDDRGRQILIGWLGGFDSNYAGAPDGLAWWHCLTVPRLLTRDDASGLLLQAPVPELCSLRGPEGAPLGRAADIELCGIAGEGNLTLDGDFQIFFERGRLGIRYLQAKGARGREERSVPIEGLRDLRVLVDGSVVEVYANGGAEVFSSRWFCGGRESLAVASSFDARLHTWPLEDVLGGLYATAVAPDLKMPGIERS